MTCCTGDPDAIEGVGRVVSSGEAYHEHFTATTTTTQGTQLVTWSTGRRNHPRSRDTTEMERLAPHSRISSAPAERRYSLILQHLYASSGCQGGRGLSL